MLTKIRRRRQIVVK